MNSLVAILDRSVARWESWKGWSSVSGRILEEARLDRIEGTIKCEYGDASGCRRASSLLSSVWLGKGATRCKYMALICSEVETSGWIMMWCDSAYAKKWCLLVKSSPCQWNRAICTIWLLAHRSIMAPATRIAETPYKKAYGLSSPSGLWSCHGAM